MTFSSTEIQALGSVALDHYHSGRLEQALEQSRLVIDKADTGKPSSLLKAEMCHLEAACLHQLERGQEAELAIQVFEEDPEAAADHAAIIPTIRKEIEEAEWALAEFAKIHEAHGISA